MTIFTMKRQDRADRDHQERQDRSQSRGTIRQLKRQPLAALHLPGARRRAEPKK